MRKPIIFLGCLALLSACGGGDGSNNNPPPVLAPPAPVAKSWTAAGLQVEIDRVRSAGNMPGLAMVVVENGVITTVASGNRSAVGAVPLATSDPFQVGSQTKAVTGMLVARLVEKKQLRWDSNLAELFPAWSATMHPTLRTATVEQLLRHRSGIKRDLDEGDAVQLRPLATGELTADRATTALHVLRQAPTSTPNQAYRYSNLGYMLLGMIAEKAGGATYEQLMAREVFAPLQVVAGFGFPGDAGASQPLGHVAQGAGWTPTTLSGEERYVTDLMLPAGGLMLSAPEYGKLLRAQLEGLKGQSTYLDSETFKLIHTPVDGYGFGWAVTDDATLGRNSAHAGSWGTYYVFAIVVPGANRAVAIMCNCYSTGVEQQLDALTRRISAGVRQ